MDLGDLLDTTFALYRVNFALFAGIVATITIPVTVLNLILSLFLSPAAGTVMDNLLSLIFNVLSEGALALAVSRRYLGQQISIEQAYGAIGWGTFGVLLLASLLYGLAVVFGLIFLVVPGIYLAVRFLFVSQAVVIERTSIGEAFSRSGMLVRGSWWRVFGIFIVLTILVGVFTAAGSGIAQAVAHIGGAGDQALGTVISAIVRILIAPIQLTALTLLYYDLRIRKEGFDIEHLARNMSPDQNA